MQLALLFVFFIISLLLNDERTSLSPSLSVDLLCCVCVSLEFGPPSTVVHFVVVFSLVTTVMLAVVVCLFSVCDALLFVTCRFLKAGVLLPNHFVVVYCSEVRV